MANDDAIRVLGTVADRGSAGLEEDLVRAETPATLDAIDLAPQRARDLILRARHLRNRYTVLDLAADLGRLEELADRTVAHLA